MHNKLRITTQKLFKLCAKLNLRRNAFQVPSDRQIHKYCLDHGDYYKRMIAQIQIEKASFNRVKKKLKNEYKRNHS